MRSDGAAVSKCLFVPCELSLKWKKTKDLMRLGQFNTRPARIAVAATGDVQFGVTQ